LAAIRIADGQAPSVCIGGLAMTVLALGLGYGTTMGGGDLKYGIVLSMVLGPLDASLTWAPAATAALAWPLGPLRRRPDAAAISLRFGP